MTPDDTTPPRIPDYELLKPIGKGSYGEVWLARSVTGVFRVIKIVRRDRFEDARPFLRELEGISRYQASVSGRPRQLALLHVGRNEEAGYFYYVMEPADDASTGSAIDPDRYVPLTLRELFRRRGRLTAAECLQVSLELARGLAVLHEQRLIHRDIKPSNIIFVQGVPKLADVGLVAASEESLTYVGTRGYVPPEGPGTIAADIYSFGKVLYEIATGRDREDFPCIPTEVAEGPEASIHREINTIALRACHPTPSERHATAAEIARDLELVLAGKSVAFYEGLRKRFRTYSLVGGTLVAAAAAITILMIWRADVIARANEQTRRALYRSDLAVAQLAKASGDLGRARAALQRQIPAPGETDLRGLEWSILTSEVRGDGIPLDPLPPPAAAVRSIATDPAGRWVAAAFADNRVGIWDLATRKLLRVIDNALVLGGFLSDGRVVVDEPVRALRLESPTNASSTRIETRQRLAQLLPHPENNSVLLVSPLGDFRINLISLPRQEPLHSINATALWPTYTVATFALSPDLTSLLIALFREEGARRERLIASINMISGSTNWIREIPVRVPWIRPSPDSQRFIANLGGLQPTLISAADPLLQTPLVGHTARANDATFSTDGKLVATCGADQTIRIWSTKSGTNITILRGHGHAVTAVAWLSIQDQVVSGDDSGEIRLFSLNASNPPTSASGFYADVHGDLVFDEAGKSLAVTAESDVIAVLQLDEMQAPRFLSNIFQPITLSQKSDRLVAFADDWSIRHLSLESGQTVDRRPGVPTGFSVNNWAVSPDRQKIAITGDKGELALIYLTNSAPPPLLRIDSNAVWAITFSPDSTEIWLGTQEGAILRNPISTTNLYHETAIQDGDIQAIALSPDGRWLSAALFNDSSIRVLNRINQAWMAPLIGHRRFVQPLAFTDDSSRMISGGSDGRVIVWSIPDFEEIAAFEVDIPNEFRGDEGIAALRLSPGGGTIACLTEDGRIRIWRSVPESK